MADLPTAGELKAARISSKNKILFDNISEVLRPEVLHKAVPGLAETQEARTHMKNVLNEIQQWGKLSRSSGFVEFAKDMHLQYIANIDANVWAMVLECFAKYDPDSYEIINGKKVGGKLMDDGLLYIKDHRGNVVLNKPFFYALLNGPLAQFDMRGKIKLI